MLVTAIFAHGDAVDLIGVNGARRHDGEVVPEVAVIVTLRSMAPQELETSKSAESRLLTMVSITTTNVSAVTPGVGRLLSVAVTVMS